MGLLGNGIFGMGGMGGMSGGSIQPSLLGGYYDPAEQKKAMFKQALLGAGLGLLQGGVGSTGQVLGQGLAGGLQAANTAKEDYVKQAMFQRELQQQNEKTTRENQDHQKAEADRARRSAWISDPNNGMNPQQRAYAQVDEQGAMTQYGQNIFASPSPPKVNEPPTSVQEYNFAKSQGFQGSFMDYEQSKKGKGMTLVSDGQGGFTMQMGGDGSMNGTSIPAEVGSRIGLGNEFLKNDYEPTLKAIKAGEATGPIDYMSGAFGRGTSGEVQRRMASGTDALKRALTGAGMSMSESNDYASRYQPQWSDDASTLQKKLEGLKTDLEAVASGAIKGKAGRVSDLLPSGSSQLPDFSTMSNDQLKAILNGQ